MSFASFLGLIKLWIHDCVFYYFISGFYYSEFMGKHNQNGISSCTIDGQSTVNEENLSNRTKSLKNQKDLESSVSAEIILAAPNSPTPKTEELDHEEQDDLFIPIPPPRNSRLPGKRASEPSEAKDGVQTSLPSMKQVKTQTQQPRSNTVLDTKTMAFPKPSARANSLF